MSTPINHLSELNACQSAKDWVKESKVRSLEAAWKKCERGDWMLWYAGRKAGPVGDEKRKQLVLAACACARLSLPIFERSYPGNDVVRVCIETAEKWARNKATLEALQVARKNCYAADAAYAAADAADAADAAYAAADAADAAYAADVAYVAAYDAADARSTTLKQCADIVRKWYPTLPK